MGALWRPLGLLHFLVCAPRVLQWGSNKLRKHLKINGLGRFLGTLLGRPIWTMRTKNAFPCSVVLILNFWEAFPCSVALVFGFLAFPWVVQRGPVRASEIYIYIYKTNVFFHILKTKRKRRVRQKRMREHSHAAWRSH
jgi:hypothetical protein